MPLKSIKQLIDLSFFCRWMKPWIYLMNYSGNISQWQQRPELFMMHAIDWCGHLSVLLGLMLHLLGVPAAFLVYLLS